MVCVMQRNRVSTQVTDNEDRREHVSRIRSYQSHDFEFLRNMLYEAIYVPKGEMRPPYSIVDHPAIAKYIEDWGRDHDYALVAVNGEDERIGAIWMRVWSGSARGWGYVDAMTPELSLAVAKPHRGQGVGRSLLGTITDYARAARYPALSLSVDPRNTVALRLYESRGYCKLSQDPGGSWTMVKIL